MPHMTGRDLAREIFKIRSDIPIILCTGFSDTVSEEDAKAMGMKEFVMKPIIMRELANTVRKVLDEK
jgi:two-component system cell cycle sensor histidine kinase/response regulator CckA